MTEVMLSVMINDNTRYIDARIFDICPYRSEKLLPNMEISASNIYNRFDVSRQDKVRYLVNKLVYYRSSRSETGIWVLSASSPNSSIVNIIKNGSRCLASIAPSTGTKSNAINSPDNADREKAPQAAAQRVHALFQH
jgi:hypothetical protein